MKKKSKAERNKRKYKSIRTKSLAQKFEYNENSWYPFANWKDERHLLMTERFNSSFKVTLFSKYFPFINSSRGKRKSNKKINNFARQASSILKREWDNKNLFKIWNKLWNTKVKKKFNYLTLENGAFTLTYSENEDSRHFFSFWKSIYKKIFILHGGGVSKISNVTFRNKENKKQKKHYGGRLGE